MRFDSGRQQFGIINLTVVSDYTYKHVRSHSIQEEIIALSWAGSKFQTSCHSSSREGGWVGWWERAEENEQWWWLCRSVWKGASVLYALTYNWDGSTGHLLERVIYCTVGYCTEQDSWVVLRNYRMWQVSYPHMYQCHWGWLMLTLGHYLSRLTSHSFQPLEWRLASNLVGYLRSCTFSGFMYAWWMHVTLWCLMINWPHRKVMSFCMKRGLTFAVILSNLTIRSPGWLPSTRWRFHGDHVRELSRCRKRQRESGSRVHVVL